MRITLALLGTLALLAVIFAPLERVFPARPGQRLLRPAWVVDLCFFSGQFLLFATLTTWAVSGVGAWASAHAFHAIRASLRSLPLGAHAALSLALGDLVVYWFHRACHRYDVLWRFHAVHHSAEHLDFLAAHREHPLDGILTQLCQNLPAFLLGVPIGALAALAVLRGMWAIFVHSNVRLPLGPLRWILGAPELHHWHHARVPQTLHNFANLAPWVDALFGTHHCPEGAERYALGLDEPWPTGYLAQLARPFRKASRSPACPSSSRSPPSSPAARPPRRPSRSRCSPSPSPACPPP